MITILLLVSGPGGRCSAAAGFQSKSPVQDIVSDILVIMHIDFRFVMLISLLSHIILARSRSSEQSCSHKPQSGGTYFHGDQSDCGIGLNANNFSHLITCRILP